MASTAYSGTIHDSPWSNLKGTRKYDRTNDNEGGGSGVVNEISPFEKRLNDTAVVTSRANNGDPISDPFQVHTTSSRLSVQQRQRELSETENSCRMTTIRCAIHTQIWTDFIFGVFWGLFGGSLLWRESSPDDDQSPPVTMISWALTIATLLLSRFCLASLSVGRESHSRCGLTVSAYMAPILSLVYVTTFSMTAAAGRSACVKYLHPYHLTRLLTKVTMSTSTRFHGLLTVLLVLAVTECLYWQVYQQYRWYLVQRDAFLLLHPPPPVPNTTGGTSRRRRPWWWQASGEDDSLTRHLLLEEGDVENENVDGQANDPFSGQPGWAVSSPFRPGRRRRNSNNNTNNSRWWGFQWKHPDSIDGGHDVRDDGSVDFEQVQEEWASRTEEDPFWWSRPEDHGGHGKNHNNIHMNDTSWANDKDDEEQGQGQLSAASNPK